MIQSEHRALSQEQEMLVTTVREFTLDEIVPRSEALEEFSDTDFAGVISGAAKIGLMGALVPDELGGSGLDAYSFSLALEEVASGSAGAAAAVLSHNVAIKLLAQAGRGKEVSEILGSNALACALLPGDLLAVEEGGSPVVNGESPFALNGPDAVLLVGLAGTLFFKLDVESPGTAVRPMESQLGLRPARIGTVAFEAAKADPLELDGENALKGLLSILRLGIAAIACGIMRTAMSGAYQYACDRYQGGDLIINHEQVRLMLSQMAIGLFESRELVRASCENEGTWPDERLCMIAKIAATASAANAAEDAVQILGGYGYMREQGMERLMRDAAYLSSYPENNTELRLALFAEAGGTG